MGGGVLFGLSAVDILGVLFEIGQTFELFPEHLIFSAEFLDEFLVLRTLAVEGRRREDSFGLHRLHYLGCLKIWRIIGGR